MLRVLAPFVALASLALFDATPAEAQDCRRNCRAGEKRDANGCCQARKRATGLLWVTSASAGEPIKVGRRTRGKTPAMLKVAAGEHTVVVGSRSTRVKVTRDGIANAIFTLWPAKAKPGVKPTARDGRVVVANSKIEIRQKLHFESNSHSIPPASHRLLDEIAQVMKSNVLHVEIAAHGDNKERRIVSARRAEAVVKYLVSRGVAGHRLKASARWMTQPIAANVTAKGRAANRRVEFIIH